MQMDMQEPGEMSCCVTSKLVRLLRKKSGQKKADRKRL